MKNVRHSKEKLELSTDLLLCVTKEFSDVLLRCPDVLVENFRTVDYLRFPSVKHLSDLTSKKCLSGTGWTV